MFGTLTLQAIPYHDPIIMFAAALMAITGALCVWAATRYRMWGYLYKHWFTTVDHKRIGVMYCILGFVFLLRGFVDALMMRAQQATAGPGMHGYLPAEHFAQLFSGHGTMMIFFFLMPFIIGLMNIAVPTQIGARDVAFPFLNAVSLWLTIAAGLLVMTSLVVGQFSTAGWTGYAPYSEWATTPNSGVDYWIWAIQISGIGTTLTGVNFLVTIVRERAPGMTLMRMPMFTWTTLCTTILIVLSFPVLTVVMGLLTLDRYFGMHFFTGDGGGNQMLYVSMFWAWGHPEVYILILPAFGIFSEVTATFCRKRLFGYTSMVYATMVIALLSFAVWVHHFFTMGQDPLRNVIFSLSTMLIAIPTGVKIYNWMATMYRGRITMSVPMYWTVGFIILFVIGGMSGVLLAIPGVDYKTHNSEFLVAHFHNVLIPGSAFGLFAGYHYWFPKAFGFRLNETWGKRAFWGWAIGFILAFMPLYVLGLMGMPRRMYSYTEAAWEPYLWVAALGALVVLFGIICQIVQLWVSIRDRKALADLTGDPWDGRTLEWATASPPAEYNFAVIPTVSDRDAFWDMKARGCAYARPVQYQDIHMPMKNTPIAFIIGIASFVFGFALVWHIWWLVLLAALTMLTAVIWHGCDDDTGFVIPAEDVKKIEDAHRARLAGRQGGLIMEPEPASPLPQSDRTGPA